MLDMNTIDYVSRSPTGQDSYLNAAHRLIREHRHAFAELCIERSIREEPETRDQALLLKKKLVQSKLGNLSKTKKPSSVSHLKAKANELRKKGKTLIHMGESVKKTGSLDKRHAADSRQLAEKHIAEGQRLLTQAKQIENQLRPKPALKPKPWYLRLFEWFSGKSQPDKETSPEDVNSRDLVRVLLIIAIGVIALFSLIYFLFFRHS